MKPASGVDTLVAAIADRLEKVTLLNGFGLRQVGNGPGDLQDTVIGARAELEAGDRLAQQKLPGGRDPAMLLQVSWPLAGKFRSRNRSS